MSRRLIVTCRYCFSADDVAAERAPDGEGFIYTCTNTSGHDRWQVAVWQADPGSVEQNAEREEGVLDDLYSPLLGCFKPGEPFIEHGIIEERLRALAPVVFAQHVDEAGHVMFGKIRNTASNRIGMALGVLRAQGHLVGRRLPGTGGWDFNPDIGFWALAPAENHAVLAWKDHALATGRNPDFTDQDRLGLTSRRQGVA